MKTPLTTDLDAYFGAIDMKLWFFTLDGLGLLDADVARRELDYYGLWDDAHRARREQRSKRDRFVRHAVPHARYLEQASAAPEASLARLATAAPARAEPQPRRTPPPLTRPLASLLRARPSAWLNPVGVQRILESIFPAAPSGAGGVLLSGTPTIHVPGSRPRQ